MINHLTDEDIENIKNEIPLGRMGRPEDIANTVRFLLSDESAYITGQVLGVNGGWYV